MPSSYTVYSPSTKAPGHVILIDEDSLAWLTRWTFTAPDSPGVLEFTYVASFETTDLDSIRDAFEAASTDADCIAISSVTFLVRIKPTHC